jgi:inner membrane protease subunit 1
MSFASRVSAHMRTVALGVIGYDMFAEHIGFCSHVVGPSMEPTFHRDGEIVALSRRSRLSITRGDIVVTTAPYDADRLVVKRVLALEGDQVNLQSASSPFIRSLTVPQGHVFLVGDNPDNSMDSRQYGPIPMGLVKGVVVCRVWPLSKAGPVQ